MKLVKIMPISKRAKNRVKEHGGIMEILVDKANSFMVRSVNDSWKYPNGETGKWLGTFTKLEAQWEEVCVHKNIKAGMFVDRCWDCGEFL